MKEIIGMSGHELQRMQVFEKVLRGSLTLKSGTALIGVCYRQANDC